LSDVIERNSERKEMKLWLAEMRSEREKGGKSDASEEQFAGKRCRVGWLWHGS
jgi:hypothetical protein